MQHRLRNGMTILTLLLLGACVTVPATVSTLPPPPQAVLLPAPQSTPPPVSIPEEVQPPTLPPAETVTPPPPAVATEELFAAPAPAEPAPLATAAPPDYIPSFASYYAKRFEGRRTYTGERYDPTKMTAATRDFPLHSWLKVINPANGREVNVRINDLTGKRKTPLVDLSRAAAKELGFLGKGKIRVHVIPLLPTP